MKHYLGIVLVLILVVPGGVQALLLPGNEETFGDFPATTVLYSNVYEHTDSGTYGAPSTIDDKLDFNPEGLKSEASGGASHQNDARVSFYIVANEGKYIKGLDFAESGDFSFSGLFPTGIWQTYAGIGANFSIDIYEVDGQPAVIPNVQIPLDTITPDANGWFDMYSHGPSSAKPWTGSVYIDFNQILIDQGYSFTDGVTHAYVALNNVLTTSSKIDELGNYSTSTIQKKDASGFSVTADVIPEPASLVLIMGTTSLFMFIRRRLIG